MKERTLSSQIDSFVSGLPRRVLAGVIYGDESPSLAMQLWSLPRRGFRL